MCFNVALLLRAKDCDGVFVGNDPVNWVDPLGLKSAGQLGLGNPGSYGGNNNCKSMYDDDYWKKDVEFLAKATLYVSAEVAKMTVKAVGKTVGKTLALHKLQKVTGISSVNFRAISRPIKSAQILNRVGGTEYRDTGRRIGAGIEAIRNDVY